MSEDRKSADQTKPSKLAAPHRGANGLDNSFMQAFTHAGENYLHAMTAINKAVVDVASEHMSANATAAQSLSQCQSVVEALQVNADLMRQSSEACMRNWAQLMETSNQLMSGNLDQFRKPH
jgi:hypothetical protein